MSKTKPYVIGVTGGSGVGKSMLSQVLARHLGANQTTIISTDDLLRWPRHDPSWQKYTHLNPAANDIALGARHIEALKSGKSVSRRVYDHDTGKHTKPIKLYPRRYIIHEGLHAFYGRKLSSLCDFKIFIETSDSLKRHWKIMRDTQKRGYTPAQVEASIRSRASDYEKFLLDQKKDADLVIFLSESKKISRLGDPSEIIKVNTKIFADTDKTEDRFSLSLISFLKNDMADLKSFVAYSKQIGMDKELVTDSGGNTSLKTNTDKILIKASGYRLKDVDYLGGYCHASYSGLYDRLTSLIQEKNVEAGENEMYEALKIRGQRASMEAGFHVLMEEPAIVHTHPVYVLVALCCKNTELILSNIYTDVKYTLIKKSAPGYSLTRLIHNQDDLSNIVFLKNHGLIVGSSSMMKASSITRKLNKEAKIYLSKFDQFVPFEEFKPAGRKLKGHLFPDSAILNDPKRHADTLKLAVYVEAMACIVNQPDYLSCDMIKYIQDLQIEKDRRLK